MVWHNILYFSVVQKEQTFVLFEKCTAPTIFLLCTVNNLAEDQLKSNYLLPKKKGKGPDNLFG